VSTRRSTRIAQQLALREGSVLATANTPRQKRQQRSSSTPLRINSEGPTKVQVRVKNQRNAISDNIESGSETFSEQELRSTEEETINEAGHNLSYIRTFPVTVYEEEDTVTEVANPPPDAAPAVAPHSSEYNAKFEGDKFGGDPNKLDSFLRKCQTHAKACRWSAEAMHERLPLYLTDTAEDMYLDGLNDATTDGLNNWEQDEAFMRESFPVTTTDTQRFNALHAKKQGQHESF